MGLKLITPAATLPVSLAAVKAWCGVEDDSHDTLLDQLRKAAVGHVEAVLGRSLGEQTWRLTLDGFSDAIELGKGPVLGLVADGFKYLDEAGVLTVVDPAIYTLDTITDPAWIVRNEGESWPATLDRINAVQVDFNAGWTEALLPEALRTAVCMIAGAWFDDRGAAVPKGVMDLLHPFRRIRI